MSKLVAHFEVELPGQCLVIWPENQDIRTNCSIGEFDVEIKLMVDSSERAKGPNDEHWTYVLRQAMVSVTKDEVKFPPPVIPDEKGQKDYTIQAEYFDQRMEQYGNVACKAMNRLIRFFKFKLKTPFLMELPLNYRAFKNAEWTDNLGNSVGKGSIVFASRRVHGLWGQLGVRKLGPESIVFMQQALQEPLVPRLHEEILSDAMTAIFEKNSRRAILEMAIACEVVVKRRFFSVNTPAGAAFDYLEDKSQVKVRVIDLINRIAEEAFGESFRASNPDKYKDIDHLFRCRNKIAHRGELSYRDDRGVTQPVDDKTIESWWNSVMALIEWIEARV